MEQMCKSPVLKCLEMTFEEFDSGVVSLDGRRIQMGPGLRPWRQETLTLDGLQLQILTEGGPNTYTAVAPSDLISFGVSLPCPEPLWVLGTQIRDDRMGLARPGDTVSSFAVAVCCHCVLTLSIDRFIRSCEKHFPNLAERLLAGPAVLEISKESWRRIIDLVKRVRRVAGSDEIFTNRNTQVVVAEELIRAFFDAAASRVPDSRPVGRPKLSRRQVVTRVHEYLKAVEFDPGSVAEMAKCVGMPERTLRSIIQEVFGVTPKRLLKIKSLNDIHRALRQGSGLRTVTEIAVSYGEWELGRFARNYFDLFGEYPSATLATHSGESQDFASQ